ncbi:helix-turn-helix domain-containing protein [Paenibacillus sp. GCM10023252]|uniref:helix-turn-helix domain-containing protein n=1 Tax=Paenibacillus sp. GCM10023252 TaxID=3252649 RepID=UPI003623037C
MTNNLFLKSHFFDDEQFPFNIQRYTIQQGEVIPSHSHEFIELVYVISGKAAHEMEGHHYHITSGDVFVLEPHASHSYRGSDSDKTTVYNVLIDLSLLKEELRVLQRMPSFVEFFYLLPFLRNKASFIPYCQLHESQQPIILDHLQTIEEEFKSRREGYQLIIKTRLIECFVLLSRYHQENESARQRRVPAQEWLPFITHYVQRSFKEPMTLQQLCKISGMSLSSFTAKFKESTGLSFVDYKHTLQIQYACKLLEQSNMKIMAVGYESGFRDISFFNKVFLKHKGLTPKEYRRLQQGLAQPSSSVSRQSADSTRRNPE